MLSLVQAPLLDTSAVGGTATLWEVLIALSASVFLALVLAYVYRVTHRGISYSVSFVHTLVLVTLTVAAIMFVVQTNIALALTLVGALAIVRFRTAIKEPRDVAFIFAAMAIGMACGHGYYVIAVTFTLFLSPVVYVLYRFKVGAQPTSEMLLKLHLPSELDYKSALQETFFRFLREHSLLSVESVHGGTALELVYSIHLKPEAPEAAFLDAVRAVNGNRKVVLLTGAQNVDV